MRQTWVAVLVALAGVSASGCGTIRNLASQDPEIYGGVQKDVAVIQTPPARSGVGISPTTVAMFMPVDLGLSAVGDTLTLPLAIWLRQNDRHGDDKSTVGTGTPQTPVQPPPQSSQSR
jgi:uncharacterized protein YceK